MAVCRLQNCFFSPRERASILLCVSVEGGNKPGSLCVSQNWAENIATQYATLILFRKNVKSDCVTQTHSEKKQVLTIASKALHDLHCPSHGPSVLLTSSLTPLHQLTSMLLQSYVHLRAFALPVPLPRTLPPPIRKAHSLS